MAGGWLRSQINVAAAGIDHPSVVIIGCAKVSNGPSWPPCAARLKERHVRYEVVPDFDLDEWAEGMGTGSTKRRKAVTPEDVAAVVEGAGGELAGGVNSAHALVQLEARWAVAPAAGQTRYARRWVIRVLHACRMAGCALFRWVILRDFYF